MLLAAIFLALMQAAPDHSDKETERDRCASEAGPIESPCTLPLRVSARAAEALISTRPWVWWRRSDTITMIARSSNGSPGTLCCAIQKPVEVIVGSDLVGITLRVPRIDEALLDIAYLSSPTTPGVPDVFRGKRAPAAPPRAHPLVGQVKQHQIESSFLRERRTISVYLPPDVRKGVVLPVIYLVDGATRSYAPLLEAAVRAGTVAPAILVGIESAEGLATGCAHEGYCDRRNLEYLPHFSDQGSGPISPFGRHLRFVSDEVIPFVESTYPVSARREHRIAAGFSSGAVWAVSTAARRPDLFGIVLGMSPGGRGSVSDASHLRGARVYLGAGLFEPSFLRATRERAELAKRVGADVRMREIVSGHTQAMWEILFADGIAWLLPSP